MSIKKNENNNPYLDARREWNERYGSYIESSRKWRLTAWASLAAAILAVIGITWIGSQNKIIPYVVAVDKLGNAVAVQRADQMSPIDSRVIKAQLARFIVNLRSVIVDAAAQKRSILEAYAMLNQSDPASTVINEYFQSGHSPFERAASETVTVEIKNVLPITKETWQIEWQETTHSRNGKIIKRELYKASASIFIQAPSDEKTIMMNPIGLYVREISWSRQL